MDAPRKSPIAVLEFMRACLGRRVLTKLGLCGVMVLAGGMAARKLRECVCVCVFFFYT